MVAQHGPEVMIFADPKNGVYLAVVTELLGEDRVSGRHHAACDAVDAVLAENPEGSTDHCAFPLPLLLNQLGLPIQAGFVKNMFDGVLVPLLVSARVGQHLDLVDQV